MELHKIQKRKLDLLELYRQKKAQTGGLVTGLIFGITSLIIGVIIAYVIISTLTEADLLTNSRDTFSILLESGNLNSTNYTLAEYSTSNVIHSSFAISSIINDSGGLTIAVANYSLTNGVVENISGEFWNKVNISYTFTKYSNEEVSSDALVSNLTTGINNVSSKIPTILLVAAIVLILGVLGLLVGMWQKMRMGGGGTSI